MRVIDRQLQYMFLFIDLALFYVQDVTFLSKIKIKSMLTVILGWRTSPQVHAVPPGSLLHSHHDGHSYHDTIYI